MKNSRLKDMTGLKFGELTVIHQDGNTPRGAAKWLCVCSCGQKRSVVGADLREGKSQSCGCKSSRTTMSERFKTHGMKGTKIHTCWSNMKARCKDTENKNYGGKGISVCTEWQEFEIFHAWAMANGYKEHLTIERIDNSKGYNPDNCTWTDRKQQARNRSIVRVSQDGRTFAEIAESNGIPVSVLNNRICAGNWTPEKASQTPVGSVRAEGERDATGKFTAKTEKWRR